MILVFANLIGFSIGMDGAKQILQELFQFHSKFLYNIYSIVFVLHHRTDYISVAPLGLALDLPHPVKTI